MGALFDFFFKKKSQKTTTITDDSAKSADSESDKLQTVTEPPVEEVTVKPAFVEMPADELNAKIITVIETIYDPEIPVNIYAMGLIYEINIDENSDVDVVMTLTSPNCPVAESLPKEVEDKIRILAGVRSMKLDLVFDPPWSMDKMSEAAKLELGMM